MHLPPVHLFQQLDLFCLTLDPVAAHCPHKAFPVVLHQMLHRQDRRVITFLIVCITVLVLFLIFWLVMDVIHPSIGWIQRS